MRTPITIHGIRHPQVFVYGRRIHHFWLGLAIALSDLHDWRVWLSDLRKRAE